MAQTLLETKGKHEPQSQVLSAPKLVPNVDVEGRIILDADEDDCMTEMEDIDLESVVTFSIDSNANINEEEFTSLLRLEAQSNHHANFNASNKVKVKFKEAKEWLTNKAKKHANTDNYTAATGTVTFGGFLYLLSQIGDRFIDKLLKAIVKLSNFTGKVIHGVCHGICVGAGFLLSFLFEWLFLTFQKWRGEFDANDAENNSKIYWDRVKRSFMSNAGGALAAVLTGAVVATIVGILTGGLGCVVMVVIVIVVGCLVKFGIKWLWDRNKRMFYKALKTLGFGNVHKEFTMNELKQQHMALVKVAENSIRNKRKRNKRIANLNMAYEILVLYIKTRHKEKRYLASQVEYYIKNKEKASGCLVM